MVECSDGTFSQSGGESGSAPIMGATGRPCTRIEQDVSALMAIGSPGEGHYIAEAVGPALAVPFCPAKCISS